jgi:hypothetical protein
MDAATKPKGLRIKRWQKKQLWIWRVAQKSPAGREAYERYYRALKKSRQTGFSQSEKKKLGREMTSALSAINQTQASFLKHCRKMQRLAKRGQLINGKLFCKAGLEITPERIGRYENMCHYIVRKFLPGLALWEASYSYDDLVNQCRREIFLCFLNGFDPYEYIKGVAKNEDIQKLEQTIVFGRLKSYMRRLLWRFHPDQLGGQTWSLDPLLEQRDGKKRHYGGGQEFHLGIFNQPGIFPVDFIQDQQDRLMDILNREGPEAVKQAFHSLDPESREVIQESLFRGNDWSVVDFEGEESCS